MSDDSRRRSRIKTFGQWGQAQAIAGLIDGDAYSNMLVDTLQIAPDSWPRSPGQICLRHSDLLLSYSKLQYPGDILINGFVACVLLSYAIVVEAAGFSRGDVAAMLPQSYRRELPWLRGVKEVNMAISALIEDSWPPGLATELMLLVDLRKTYVRSFRKEPFIQAIKEQFPRGAADVDNWFGHLQVQFTIPALVYSMLLQQVRPTSTASSNGVGTEQKAFRFDFVTICDQLGYTPESVKLDPCGCFKWVTGKDKTQSLDFVTPTVMSPRDKTSNPVERNQGATRSRKAGARGPVSIPTETQSLLHFISLWADGILEVTLNSTMHPQPRWTPSGNLHDIQLGQRLDKAYFKSSPFLKLARFYRTISTCLKKHWVETTGAPGFQTYILTPLGRERLSAASIYTEVHSTIAIAFIFPLHSRDHSMETGEPLDNTSRAIMPALSALWRDAGLLERLMQDTDLVPMTVMKTCRYDIIQTTLGACKTIGAKSSGDALNFAKALMRSDAPKHQHYELAVQHSKMLRSLSFEDLAKIETDLVFESGPPLHDDDDVRTKCQYYQLLLSQAENAIISKDFKTAEAMLSKCIMPIGGILSLMEMEFMRSSSTHHGRILRYTGKFGEALNCFELCLDSCESVKRRFHVLHHLCDVLCELDREGEVEQRLLPSLGQIKAASQCRSKAFRRLSSSLAEVYLKQGRLGEAAEVLSELDDCFRAVVVPDISDQLGHIQTLIGLVRLSIRQEVWLVALGHAQAAYDTSCTYATFLPGNFYVGMILRYQAFLLCKTGDRFQAEVVYERSMAYNQLVQHFVVGLGTYVERELRKMMKSCKIGD